MEPLSPNCINCEMWRTPHPLKPPSTTTKITTEESCHLDVKRYGRQPDGYHCFFVRDLPMDILELEEAETEYVLRSACPRMDLTEEGRLQKIKDANVFLDRILKQCGRRAVGLTMNQLGDPQRIAKILYPHAAEPTAEFLLINPVITHAQDWFLQRESSLCIHNGLRAYIVPRAKTITAEWVTIQDDNLVPMQATFTEESDSYIVYYFQHLVDQLDGVMISDYQEEKFKNDEYKFRWRSAQATMEELHRKAHTPVRVQKVPGRNDSCSCGSEKKYKRCCGT